MMGLKISTQVELVRHFYDGTKNKHPSWADKGCRAPWLRQILSSKFNSFLHRPNRIWLSPNDTVPDRCFPTCEPLPNHVLLIAINERERERLANRWNRKKWKKSWTERAAGDDHAGVSDVCRDTDASEGEHLLFVGFGIYGVSDVCSRVPSGLRPPAFCTSKLNCKGMA
jgi:hypothetical protein